MNMAKGVNRGEGVGSLSEVGTIHQQLDPTEAGAQGVKAGKEGELEK